MRIGALALALLVIVAGCADSDEGRIIGTVVAYDGGADGVESFDVVSESGERITFEPAPGLDTFAHGGPLTHLLQHLQTGAVVEVAYRVEGEVFVAIGVDDA